MTASRAAQPDLSRAFAAVLPRTRRSPMYHAGLALTALFVVLVPLVYVAMIGAVGWAVVWHATHNVRVFEELQSGRAAVLLYVGPLVVGGGLVILMVKPLFAPRAEEPFWVEVSRADEPVLWAYVERLCQTVRAPTPRRIRVDCHVNASASFRRGFLSLLGSDLVLTVGLPLVAGMDLRQFTGVLAHEFGHFAQGGGMRATYVIDRTNRWLARVAYEDDAWDEGLRGATRSGFWPVMLIAAVMRLCVWLTRLILRVLLHVAHAVSCFMSRRMEFDADRCQARVAGSAAFEPTFRRLTMLDVASGGALQAARELWGEQKLPDSLPMLTVSYLGKIPEKAREEIWASALKPSRHLFATHPGTADRIRAAESLAEPGVLEADAPATALFRDFKGASVRATYDLFKGRLGEKIMRATFVPTEGVIAEDSRREEAGQTAAKFFRELVSFRRPVTVGIAEIGPAEDPRRAARRLLDLTVTLDREREALAAAYEGATKALDRLEELDQAEAMLNAGLRLGMQRFNVSPARRETVDAERERARAELASHDGRVDRAQRINRERLRLALSLLLTPGMEKRLPGASRSRRTVEEMLPLLRQMEGAHGDAQRVIREHQRFEAIGAGLRRDSKELAVREFMEVTGALAGAIAGLRARFAGVEYPFDHARRGTDIAAYLLELDPPRDDPNAVHNSAARVLDRYMTLSWRVLGELTSAAAPVETLVLQASRRAPAQ